MKTDLHEDLGCRYLLGDLTQTEQLAFEQGYFSDDEAFERLWGIENRLVDRYVRGRLTASENGLFEQNYLASPIHRERVAFARALVEAADSTAEGGEAHTGTEAAFSWWSSFLTSLSGDSWRWATIAAMLLLTVAGVGLLSERARLHKQISQINDESASEKQRVQELEKEMAAEREQSDKLAAEIQRLQKGSRNAEALSQTAPPQSEVRSIISFLLSPMLMRSGGEAQQVKISKGIDVILLQMKVQQPDARLFQSDLRTVEGAKIWSRASIKAGAQTRNGSLVSVSIPASKLAAGDYILTLSATHGANEREEVNRYFFRVVK
jgi:hypothetical protein